MVVKLPKDPVQRAARLKELRPMMESFVNNKCSCSKERAAYKDLSDESLRIIYNAKAQGSNADLVGGEDGSKSVQAGGEEDGDHETADHYSSREAPGLDDGIHVGDEHAGGAALSQNQLNQLSMRLFGVPHKNVMAAMNYTREQEERARHNLLERLTANAQSDKLKQSAWEVYARMDLPTLRRLAAALPPPDSAGYYPTAQTLANNYLGAAGGPVDNFMPEPEQDPDDVLQMPTLNYSEIAEEQRQEGRKRAQ